MKYGYDGPTAGPTAIPKLLNNIADVHEASQKACNTGGSSPVGAAYTGCDAIAAQVLVSPFVRELRQRRYELERQAHQLRGLQEKLAIVNGLLAAFEN
jgi:hypothetical protein